MDSAHFEKFDEIRLKPDALDYYFALYGDVAWRSAAGCGWSAFSRSTSHGSLHVLRASYLAC